MSHLQVQVCVYYCSTYYKAAREGGGGGWRTCGPGHRREIRRARFVLRKSNFFHTAGAGGRERNAVREGGLTESMELTMQAAQSLDAHHRACLDDDGEYVQLAMVCPRSQITGRLRFCAPLRDASPHECCAETPAIAALMDDLPHATHARAGAIQLQRNRSG